MAKGYKVMFDMFHKRNLKNKTKIYKIEDLMTFSIKEKIDFLKTYDKNFQIFGSEKHKYILNEPLCEEIISNFEDTFQVKLPSDYRNFINTIGNGGAGPGYGIFPLFNNEKSYQNKFLSSQFLLKDDLDLDLYEEQISCDCLECEVCKSRNICLFCDVEDGTFKYQIGTLAICFEGCTYYRRLTMNGEIWAESEGEGMKRTRTNFLTWYEDWLNISIKTILPFVNAALSCMLFDEIMNIEGSGLFHFNYRKARFIAGMFGFNIDLPTNSGALQDKYVQAVKKAYDAKLK